MKDLRSNPWLARSGLLLGLALAAIAVAGWTMPAGDRAAGLAAELSVMQTGELGVAPSGRVLTAPGLRAGDPGAATSFVVTNQTGRRMALWLRATAAAHDVDAALRIDARLGRRAAIASSLGVARGWRRGGALEPGERRRVRVGLSVPSAARDYEARTADVQLELRAEALR